MRDAAGRFSAGAVNAARGAATADNARTVLALGIKSALYHLAGLDDAAMEIVEPFVHDTVHNAAAHLSVATGRAQEAMRGAVQKMIAAKRAA